MNKATTMRSALAAAMTLAGLAAGCDGGGAVTATPRATGLRALQPGDTWVFDVTEETHTALPNTPERSARFTGRMTVTITQGSLNNEDVLVESQAVSVVDAQNNVVTANTQIYLSQDAATNELRLLAKSVDSGAVFARYGRPTNGVVTPLKERRIERPGRWEENTDFSAVLEFPSLAKPDDPVETLRQVRTVVGSETVRTGPGFVTAWKVSALQTGQMIDANGQIAPGTAATTANGTYWYAPELGTYVRAEERFSDPATGTTGTRTLRLTSARLITPPATP